MAINVSSFEEVVVVEDDSSRLRRLHAAANAESSCTDLITGVELLVERLELARKSWKGLTLIDKNEFDHANESADYGKVLDAASALRDFITDSVKRADAAGGRKLYAVGNSGDPGAMLSAVSSLQNFEFRAAEGSDQEAAGWNDRCRTVLSALHQELQ